jgi:glycosyltransferase involved in cell wall biosynthesis
MIVKNEEKNLARALASVKGLVDEIIIIDSGSTDGTRSIAAGYNALIFDKAWQDDYSEIRNFGLRKAQGTWILVLDADEAIAERDHAAVREIMDDGRYDGAYFYQRNYFEDPLAENWCANRTDYEEGKPFAGYADVPVLRFFRNTEHIFYEGIIHEIVDETIDRKRVKYTDIPIHHFREDLHGEGVRRKQEKYLRILLKDYEKNPGSVKTCFLLGRQFHDLKMYPEAVAYLERAVQLGTNSEMVSTNLASAYYHCTMFAEAIEVLEKVVAFNERYSEAFLMLGLSYYETGKAQAAVNALVKAITLRPTSVLYHYNLGVMYYKERDLEAAETTLRTAVRYSPRFTRALYLLFYVLLEREKTQEAAEVARILDHTDKALYEKIKDKVVLLQAK